MNTLASSNSMRHADILNNLEWLPKSFINSIIEFQKTDYVSSQEKKKYFSIPFVNNTCSSLIVRKFLNTLNSQNCISLSNYKLGKEKPFLGTKDTLSFEKNFGVIYKYLVWIAPSSRVYVG